MAIGSKGMNGAAEDARQFAADHISTQERIADTLGAILAELIGNVDELALTDGGPDGGAEVESPYPGIRRRVVNRQPVGQLYTATTTPAEVLRANRNRIGLQLVNAGTEKGAYVILGAAPGGTGVAALAGRGVMYLAPNGGAWDGRISGATWCGKVTLVTAEGSTSITIAEA